MIDAPYRPRTRADTAKNARWTTTTFATPSEHPRGGKIKIFAATESSDGSVRAFHNDANTGENNGLFDFISLRSNDGTEKQAYDYLRALRSL